MPRKRKQVKRTESREAAFLLVFEQEFNGDIAPENIVATALEERGLETDEYCRELFAEVIQNRQEDAKRIAAHSKNWDVSRISRVSRNILHLALAEMRLKKAPVSVIINEAVELSKKYEARDAAAFVNGVLGAIAAEDGGGQ